MTTPTPHSTPETLEQRATAAARQIIQGYTKTLSDLEAFGVSEWTVMLQSDITTALLAFYREGGDARAREVAEWADIHGTVTRNETSMLAMNAVSSFALSTITPPEDKNHVG